MTSSYHKNIQKAILGFGKDNPKKYIEIFTGEQKPIHIHHPIKKHKEILYKPDAHFKTRTREVYVFEILYRELRHTSEIIADVTESLFTPDISKIFFIIPKNGKEVDKLIEISEVIIGTLDFVGFRKYPLFVAVYPILKKEASNIKTVKKLLSKLSKEDKW